MFKLNNLPLTISTIVLISLIVGWGISMVLAWEPPTASPPDGNVFAPINVSSTGQIKDGTFGARISAVYVTSGNFGSEYGTGDYYFPDDVGIGTTNPNYPLHIDRPGVGSTVYLQMTQDGTGSGVADGLLIGVSADEKVYIMNKENTDMIFRTNDQDRVTIDNSGNVGIGTTSPASKLDIKDAEYGVITRNASGNIRSYLGYISGGDDGQIYLYDSSDTLKVFLDTAGNSFFTGGNVGIGTTGPSNKLEVDGGSAETRLRISTTGIDAKEAGIILANSSKTAFNDGIVISHGGGYTLFEDLVGNESMRITPQVGAAGNVAFAGNITATGTICGSGGCAGAGGGLWSTGTGDDIHRETGNVGIGTTSPGEKLSIRGQYAQLGIMDSDNEKKWIVGTNSNADLYISEDDNTDANMRLYLKAGGNVGIGTMNPTRKLTVDGGFIEIRSGNDLMLRPTANDYDFRLRAESYQLNIYAGGDLVNPRMSILNSGNVGIGTTSPATKLHVSGDNTAIRLTGGTYTAAEIRDGGTGDPGYFKAYYNGNLDCQMGAGGTFFAATTGSVGIGTTTPNTKLELKGNHASTLFRMYATDFGQPAASNDAYLSFWASEPGVTYTGVGIGNNIAGNPYYGRINTARGGSYIRLLDTAIYLNTINSAGTDINNMYMSGGNVGIGTTTPSQKLDVNGNINASTIGATEYCINPSGGCITTWPTNTDTQDLSIDGHTISLTDGGSVIVPDNYAPDTWITTQTCSAGQYLSSVGKTTKTCSVPPGGITGDATSRAKWGLPDSWTDRPSITGDVNYWTGSQGWGADSFDTVLPEWGSTFFDVWSNPAGQPSGTSHWQGVQAFHYWNGSTGYGSQLVFGSPMMNGALFMRSIWGGGWGSWYKVWTEGTDGSGSGLDADLLDGQNGSYYRDNTDTQNLSIVDHTISLTNGGSVIVPDNYAPNTTVDGCTNCLNATEIEDIYVFNTSDTMSGNLTVNAQVIGGFGAQTTGGTADWNHITNARSGGGYTLLLGSHANGPGPGSYFHPFSFEYSSKNGNGNLTQLAIPYGSPASVIYYRGRYSGSWTSWRKIIAEVDGTATINKLTVGTIDPVYEIDGIEYATYVADFAGGVRMETSGVVQLNSEAKYVIDFDNLEKGTDLWLFWETSNKEMDDLAVVISAGFEGKAWYNKDGHKLTIYGDEPGEVSYRLTLPRLDDEEWGNLVVSDKE